MDGNNFRIADDQWVKLSGETPVRSESGNETETHLLGFRKLDGGQTDGFQLHVVQF